MSLLKTALSQYGIKEISGNVHNPVIVNYAKEIGMSWVATDEVPWCSIFMNWCAFKAGYIRSNKADARSWLRVGEETTEPEVGDVVVFKRGTSAWEGHVGLFISEEDGYVNVLGGNQSDSVKIAKYSKGNLLGYRRLTKIAGS